ncbi:LysR family transcriptional regulator [Zophobihabitans entericus]|uniref:LysR family transcriptional regulator n=1 Tax=Zophobihabitans entericus TaxID=1635327 RepID=A0A6G9ICI1_9GAMM|nr:LysR family transcriptional regulator [Zophobihabitans entericus]QIQ21414.1 LysR family transcriptional regulator [Zophobihabitans entericus]
MEIKVLRYFLALAKEESVTAAAEYLHLTQPTLSRQLSELEEQLGTKLFLRGSRKITLTDEGIRLRKRAEEILELVQKTEAEFHMPTEEIRGDIYIGGGETHAMVFIAKIIKNLRDNFPHLHVHLFSGNADDVTERIDKGLLDFGVLIGSTNMTKYESLTLPQKDTWGILMRKDSPLAERTCIQPQDLTGLPLIGSKQKHVDEHFSKWMEKDYKRLNIVATYNLIFNASLMVEKGIGYALCLDKLVNTTGNSHLCFKPLNPVLEADINIVWKRYQVFSKASELFLQQLKKAFSQYKP